uniref:Uncharacterized protein n=1 Tax=Arundo donax TaxID=35708 RepID=A0A0A9GQZ0_ARUDO
MLEMSPSERVKASQARDSAPSLKLIYSPNSLIHSTEIGGECFCSSCHNKDSGSDPRISSTSGGAGSDADWPSSCDSKISRGGVGARGAGAAGSDTIGTLGA